MAVKNSKTQVLVLGSGPGGYTAAFRAADLGFQVTLVEKESELGGVCLNVGCIPSKALLHMAEVIDEAKILSNRGVSFGNPVIDVDKVRGFKESVVKRLNVGLKGLAKQRKVTVVQGTGKFSSPNTVVCETATGSETIEFEYAIIAVGSRPVVLPFLPSDPRIMDSTGALALKDIPKRLLVIGGGIIGMEMASVYHALGSEITVVEMAPGLLGNVDKDIAAPLLKRVKSHYANIMLETRVTKVEALPEGLKVTFEGKEAPQAPEIFDRILSSVGRVPNGATIGAAEIGIKVDERGFIPVDKQLKTNLPHIFAIGDVAGNPMLAHKSIAEGRIAAECLVERKRIFEPKCIPSVAYTDPEVAWVGLTENEAKAQGIPYEKSMVPWAANGRSLSLGRDEGLTKLLFDPSTHRILGGAAVGPHAGDLMGEVALAIEMGCEAEDISLTIHAHPTLSETIVMATEAFEGTITDLYMPKVKK
ncbi:MAG: Dihydrolipoyl dehydrogenase [Pseudomonadota bacterium]|jgi:dihydrolipoamide dehydrogenase